MHKVYFICLFLNKDDETQLDLFSVLADIYYELPITPTIGMEIDIDSFVHSIDFNKSLSRDVFGICKIERIVICPEHLVLYLSAPDIDNSIDWSDIKNGDIVVFDKVFSTHLTIGKEYRVVGFSSMNDKSAHPASRVFYIKNDYNYKFTMKMSMLNGRYIAKLFRR
jgi:translation elongation factor EF-G